jgi:hypothetical protein
MIINIKNFAAKLYNQGIPVEKRGRKAVGLRMKIYDSLAALAGFLL